MAEKIRVGVMGLGMGADHLNAYRACPEAEVVALCDRDAGWLEHIHKDWPKARVYTGYREMLQDKQLEAVSICLPTGLHAEATSAALQAGKHVLCEKPMALNTREAETMVKAAHAAKRTLMISQNQRFTPQARFLHELIEQGGLGEIYYIRAGWRRPMGLLPSPVENRATGPINRNWFNEREHGGGVLRDLGSHLLDLSLWLLGFPAVAEVMALNRAVFSPQHAAKLGHRADAEDFSASLLRFSNGTGLQLEVSFGAFVEQEVTYLDFYGTRSGASLRNGSLKLYRQEHEANTATTLQKFLQPAEGPQAHFIHCLQQGVTPLVTGEQGITVIGVLDKLYASGIHTVPSAATGQSS